MENGAKARLAARGQQGVVYMAEITRRTRTARIKTEASDGRPSLPRTCNVWRQRQPAQCPCMLVCTQRSSRHVASTQSRARRRRLRVGFDVGHRRAERTRRRLRSGVTFTDGDTSRLSRFRAVPGSERGSSGNKGPKT
jgi:hypothetical protein